MTFGDRVIAVLSSRSAALASRTTTVALLAGLVVAFTPAHAKSVKIGVLTDMSGVYADLGGRGSVRAAEQAIAESGLAAQGWTVELVSADHQNKPDIGVAIARAWFEREGVDMIVDVPNSGVALAISQLAREKNKVLVDSGAGTSDLTGPACSPNTVHWTYDTYALAKGSGTAITRTGASSWFFLTADYNFGAALERDTRAAVIAAGGSVLGGVRHPLNSADFSSYLLQAQSSGAKVIGLANAGNDTTNAIKQAAEFGITTSGQTFAPLLLLITDVHALGLKVAAGLTFTEMFYWDLNDRTRAFSARYVARGSDGRKPTMTQAGVYAGTLHYLKAVAARGTAEDGRASVAKMKEMATDDDAFGPGTIRADGRKLHPAYLFRVKTPAESKAPWDYYTLLATLPPEQAWRPLSDGHCPLLGTP